MTKPLRIMLIDDEEFDLMMYRRIIDRSGLVGEVVTLSTAQAALDYFKQTDAPDIDLIFLDIRMPILSGFDFLELVEPYLPEGVEVPVIMMLTTSMSTQDRDRAATFERVVSYMNKPLTQSHLQDAVKLVETDSARI